MNKSLTKNPAGNPRKSKAAVPCASFYIECQLQSLPMTLCILQFLLCHHFPPTDLACYLQQVFLMQHWKQEKEVTMQINNALNGNRILFL